MSPNTHRPRIFLGSASESAHILDVLVELLGYSVDCTSWQYADQLSLGVMENLEQLLPQHDFAAMLFSPEDDLTKRNVTKKAPRDNVIFELGFFMGGLGRRRTFIIKERGVELDIPTDLQNIQPAEYTLPANKNWRVALTPVAAKLKRTMSEVGART